MSTRSGKRLHNAFNENIEPELARKTRGKRIVENSESLGVKASKKRQNYVSFPSEEEAAEVNSLEDEAQLKPVRALRRQTLKEQNAATAEVDTAIIAKKQGRSTRRTKKLSETATDDAPDVPVNEEPIEVVTFTNTKQKSKKNKKKSKKEPEVTDKENEVKAGKKKTNKKKKNSLVEQGEAIGKKKNDSNVSTDSFHSAAGSPQLNHGTPPLNNGCNKLSEDTETLSVLNTSANKRSSSLKRISELNTSTKKTMEVNEVVESEVTEVVTVRASKRRSSLKIVDKDRSPETVEKVDLYTTFEKVDLNTTFEKVDLNTTFEKVDLNTTFEKEPAKVSSSKKKKNSNVMETNTEPVLKTTSPDLDDPKTSEVILNTTFGKNDVETDVQVKKNKKSDNKDLTNDTQTNKTLNVSFEIRRSPRKSVNGSEKNIDLNGTFELSPKPELTKQKSLDSTFDKESKLDSTFDKESKLDSTFDKTIQKPSLGSKSSLITSDDATNSSIVTLDKSDDNSKINITDDDSKTENILNTTPLLIESSMEESRVSVLESSLKENKTPDKPISTPLKREGTFTKDSPTISPMTPNKRQTLPAAGCTPYHSDRKGSQKERTLNQTHSIEKPSSRSSLAEIPTRMTRVMFCSPVNNPGVATQRKSKIIKSNLKGSNKSFVFEDSDSLVCSVARQLGRKRSWTHTEGEREQAGNSKRTRLHAERPPPPPPRARANSAAAKLSNAATPSKATPKSEVKATGTKLPNFAALHARRFERMESLDECQQRKAKRARQLLVPTGSVAVLERSSRSPRVTPGPKQRDLPAKTAPAIPAPAAAPPAPAAAPPAPAATAPAPAPASKPVPKPPTLETLQRGYTRFGFKMQCGVNPFSVPPNTTDKPKAVKPNGIKPNGLQPNRPVALKREVTQPSLAGATSLRRAVAKQTIMREKSFTLAAKRNETRTEVRTVIKGVRTNRRFELQMKSRNLNG